MSHGRLRQALGIGCLTLVVLVSGCASRPDVAQPRQTQPAGEIWGDQTVGQTFTATRDGLQRIDLQLATYARPNTGGVVFHLRAGPDADEDLATVEFEAADVEDNSFRTFSFPTLDRSRGQVYYFFLEAPTAGPGNAITVWSSATDTYAAGQRYQAGKAQAGDLVFRTYTRYDTVSVLADVGQGLRRGLKPLVLGLLLYTLPGLGLHGVTRGFRAAISSERAAQLIILGAGLSVGLGPLIVLAGSLASFRLGRYAVVGALAASAALIALAIARSLRSGRSRPDSRAASSRPVVVLLVVVFSVSVAVRLLAVQDLAAPMWGDGYHHTLIAQLIVDHGGLFQSWEPYAPLRSFTYHFGFHSNVALFHWLTGIPVLKSVIIVGQILNALAALMIYPLSRRLGASPEAGLVAVLIASLLSPTPAIYVNWARYTQLTAMVVMPVAATLLMDATTAENRMSGRILVAGIAAAGLFLSHYLVSLLFAAFVIAYLAWRGLAYRLHGHSRSLTAIVLRTASIAALALLLLVPWLVTLMRGGLPGMLASRFSPSPEATYFQTAYNAAADFSRYVPGWLAVLGAGGAVWGVWRRRELSIVVSTWIIFLVLLANPAVVGLPGTGVVHNFLLLIALYLPLSLLAGAVVAATLDRLTARWPTVQHAAVALVLTAALVGARARLMDVDLQYRLVTWEDRTAMAWIEEQTPPDARFLVNSFTAFGATTVVGSDAGWWIPYLAERRNTVPPTTYGMEAAAQSGYAEDVGELYQTVSAQPLSTPEAAEALAANGISHVYVGAVGGDLLDPAELMSSSYYDLVYNEDGVLIFEVK